MIASFPCLPTPVFVALQLQATNAGVRRPEYEAIEMCTVVLAELAKQQLHIFCRFYRDFCWTLFTWY